MRITALTTALAASLCPDVVTAATDMTAKSGVLEPGSGLGASGLLETAGGLMIVLLLIVGLAWVYRRMGSLPGAGKGMLRVVGGLSLGARERVMVVEIEGQRLVLGVAPGRVEKLHVLPPAATTETSFTKELESQIQQAAS